MFGCAKHPHANTCVLNGRAIRVKQFCADDADVPILSQLQHAFERVNGFDEALAVGFGDVDLCLRVREQGFSVLYCAHAEMIHHESYTRGKSAVDPHPEDSALFQSKWRKMLAEGDPFYNPGLSLVNTTWQHANPLPFRIDIKRRVFVRRDPASDHHD